MASWRRIGVPGILAGGIGLAILPAGCSGGGSGTTGPTGEVEIVQPVDAQGNVISIEDENKPQAKTKK